MSTQPPLPDKHNFIAEITFRAKAAIFILQRSLHNIFINPVQRFEKCAEGIADVPVISSSESELWNTDDNAANRILTAGKVQNLRVAVIKLNGIEVKANRIFSFWRHIGYPSKFNGFVMGREIREGCIVPTVAGGLCQLSNALYDAALKAGFEIIERHAHTRVIKGSLAENGRDATVKWNYVDLRFRAPHDFKIFISLSADSLMVQFAGNRKGALIEAAKPVQFSVSKLNDCYSCGNTTCFKHPDKMPALNIPQHSTAFILDEKWPEFEQYIYSVTKERDFFIVPFIHSSRFKIRRYSWEVGKRRYSFPFVALRRALALRFAAAKKENIPSVYQKYDKRIIDHIKKNIPIECTHIVIAQNLLPFAWEQGLLGGRTFDVLMTRLPIEILQQKLDDAHRIHPESETLNDFRAEADRVTTENAALTHATRIVTPHQEIAGIFNNKLIKLDWHLPKASEKNYTGDKVLFPASSLARKGAYEMRRLAKELSLKLVVIGKATEMDDFWQDINVSIAEGDIFKDIALVVLPSYIEHQPRLLLKALANHIPVIATEVCGITANDNLTIVPASNYEALKTAVITVLNKRMRNERV